MWKRRVLCGSLYVITASSLRSVSFPVVVLPLGSDASLGVGGVDDWEWAAMRFFIAFLGSVFLFFLIMLYASRWHS